MIEDLARAIRLDDARRLVGRRRAGAGDAPPPVPRDPALDERLADHVRVESVTSAVTAASAGADDPGPARALVLRAFATAAIEIDAEIEAVSGLSDRPPVGWEAGLAREADPAGRDGLHARWRDGEDRLDALRAERRSLLDGLAVRLGGSDADALVASLLPGPSGAALAERAEREAVAPLDDLVAATRRRLDPVRGGATQRPDAEADEAARRAAVGLRDAVPGRAIARAVGRAAAGAGADPAAGTLAIETDAADGAWAEALDPDDGVPTVVLGVLDGPCAAWRALGEAGAAVRRAFLRDRAAAAPLADPAFDEGARALWRRLALARESRAVLGLGWGPDAEAVVRLEEALVPRLAWAYVSLAAGRGAGDDAARLVRRAGTLPGWPGVRAQGDPLAAGVLRGTIYGLLLEERLMTRYGRHWFADRAALRFLRDVWDAEPGRPAEAVAADLDVGTMDGAPILDRCRPE